jgi:hypothetical protein
VHTGQAECEARDAAIGEKIDGKIERVEMCEGLKALREQKEVAVVYAAALQPEQL